jgi:hypothetical protein
MGEATVSINSAGVYEFYREYVRLINPLLKLREREQDTLAELLYSNYKHQDVKDKDIRWRVIFDYDNRVALSKSIGISIDAFNNNLTRLRHKGVIVNNQLAKHLQGILPNHMKEFNLTFKFKIAKHD